MTAEQLKNSILQEAISGRLVPQNPNDEPASVLLQRIREEKARLVKEGKLKKKDLVETPITDDEKPFEIPDSWEWVRLSTYVDVRDGTHDSPKYHPLGIPFVTSKNLKNGRIDFSTCTFISQSDHDKFSERSYVEDGDILFAMIGSIGNPVIVAKDREFSVKNVALFKRYSREYTNNKYLYYYLSYIQNELKQIAAGGVQSFVGLGTLRQYLIPLPPLAEQKRIVAKLEELLPIVEQYGKAQKELDELNATLPARLRQSILQEAISGRLVPQDPNEGTAEELLKRIDAEKQRLKLKTSKKFESLTIEDEPFDIPETWRWRLLGDLAAEDMGKTPPRGESIYWEKAIYPWVSIADMKDYGHIKTTKEAVSEHAAQKAFRNISPIGSLLMSFKLTVGRTSILDIEAYHNEAIITIKPFVDENYAFRNYLFYILPLIANMGDSKDAIKGKTLNSTSLYALPIPLPPLAEQKRIVAKLEELFAEIDKLK